MRVKCTDICEVLAKCLEIVKAPHTSAIIIPSAFSFLTECFNNFSQPFFQPHFSQGVWDFSRLDVFP